jgi:enoyl-CoA hydratase
MSNSTVTQSTDNDVTVIILDDGKVNAFNPSLIEALDSALDKTPQDRGAVVITGRPGVFSAGFDLKVVTSGNADTTIDLIAAGGRLLGRIFEYPRPVVIACTGHAPALGALLLLTADYRVGADGDFVIGLNEVRDNLVVPRCFLELVHHRVPPIRRTQVVLHSKMYEPSAATGVGFLDEVVDPDRVIDTAIEHAHRLAALAHPAYGITKRRERGQAALRIYQSLENELTEDVLDMIAGDLGATRRGS